MEIKQIEYIRQNINQKTKKGLQNYLKMVYVAIDKLELGNTQRVELIQLSKELKDRIVQLNEREKILSL